MCVGMGICALHCIYRYVSVCIYVYIITIFISSITIIIQYLNILLIIFSFIILLQYSQHFNYSNITDIYL